MNNPIAWNFTYTCQTCGETVNVTNGRRPDHPCAEPATLVIEGCDASTPLAERVEQALADYEQLTTAEETP